MRSELRRPVRPSRSVSSPGEHRHLITVADLGPGIDDADKAAALTRFWRADTSTPGTGLGLAICEALVRSGGGELRLADNTPHGLVVTLDLVAALPHRARRRLAPRR